MLTAYLIFSVLLASAYGAIMRNYWHGWRSLPAWILPKNYNPTTPVTVVIPARNEAENIGECLRSILAGTYSPGLLEIIVVDDHSEDATAQIVAQIAESQAVKIRLLRLADFVAPDERLNSHKKKAIETALAHASGELIVTTDADCICPPDWLRLLVSVFERWSQVRMVAAPVLFHRERGLLERFQSLDFAGMMGITGAGIHLRFQRMGNGANLAYRKSAFEAVGGYAGVDGRASGDDVFLMQKIAARWPNGSVFFLKNAAATVLTEAKPTLREFVRQRIRWGSKNAASPERRVTLILAAVFFFCWNILLNAVLLVFFPRWELGMALAIQLIYKALADWRLLREMCVFFGRRDLLRWFWPSFFMHIVYIAGVGAASQFFQKYEWKGRRVR
ncbi:MAG: glycosyltransferase [Saprospiraceae bacterium]